MLACVFVPRALKHLEMALGEGGEELGESLIEARRRCAQNVR